MIESVFRGSGPNSKSTVTLTRPVRRKNASLHLLPLSWALLPLATLILIIVKQKSTQEAQSLRQMQFHSMPNAQRPEILRDFLVSEDTPVFYALWVYFRVYKEHLLIKYYIEYPILSIWDFFVFNKT